MSKSGPSLSMHAVNAGQLDDALSVATPGTGDLVLIEAVLPADDTPPLLNDIARALSARAA